MGHAGAIISGGKGTAADKFAALEDAGIATTQSPAELATTLQRAMKGAKSASKPSKRSVSPQLTGLFFGEMTEKYDNLCGF